MKIIWVATDGSDATGTGAQETPYASIERALQDMGDGDQIRILDGTYISTDSIVISGISGSIFAENPRTVYIQPQKTKNHQACLAIIGTDRFSVTGINIIQAADSGGNLIGMYVENVENFIAYTCSVFDFEVPSGNCYGIYAAGGGRVENCEVHNFACAGDSLYGISTLGVDVIDCSVVALSGIGRCVVTGIHYSGFND
jgi:hypothetical protein